MSLNAFDKLGRDIAASDRQSAVMGEKTAAGAGNDHAVKRGEVSSSGRRLAEHLRDGLHILVCDRMPSFLN